MGISILAWLSSLDPYGGLGMITRPIWKCPCINLYLFEFAICMLYQVWWLCWSPISRWPWQKTPHIELCLHGSFLDLYQEIDSEDLLRTKCYDQDDAFNVPIVNFPLIFTNIPVIWSIWSMYFLFDMVI